MAKKNRNRAAAPCEKGKYNDVSAGHYTPKMTDLLGYDIIKNVYDSTILAIEDSQNFTNEVRTKGLQCAGLLMALIVCLITCICTIKMLEVRIIMAAIAFVLTKTLYGLLWGIIYKKENGTRGNTQSYMLNQEMIDALGKIDENKRAAFFLASRLKGMEAERLRLDEQTTKMQKCFEQETRIMIVLLTGILIIVSVIYIVFYSSMPAF